MEEMKAKRLEEVEEEMEKMKEKRLEEVEEEKRRR